MPTHRVGSSWEGGSLRLSQNIDITSDSEVNIDLEGAAAVTNLEVDVVVARANIKSMFIEASKDLTIKTNNSSTPDNTLAIVANKPLSWQPGYFANPLTADLTQIFVTCAVANWTCKIRILLDNTP